MKSREMDLIHKFLKMNFGDLKLEKKPLAALAGETYTSLKRDKKTYFIHEQHRNVTQINLDSVVRPIVNIFNTDFEETREFVIEWFFREYNIDNTKK